MRNLVTPWEIGAPRRATAPGLPLPGHRSMAEVLADEKRRALDRGAVAFAKARKLEDDGDGSA